MSLNERIIIDGDQIHKGGEVDVKSSHKVPVGDSYLPWHQGKTPDWKRDDYAEYVKFGEDVFSLMDRKAHRIKVAIETIFTNDRRYHDWKGYDDVEPLAHTKVWFNDIKVGSVRAYPADILRHLMAVHDYIEALKNLPAFGWWSEEDIAAEIGRQVDYDGYPGVIASLDNLDAGEMLIYAPTWPDDGYDRGGRLLTPLTYDKIDWHPDSSRGRVYAPDPLWGGSEE